MTDEEILKALKLCTSEHMGCEDGCPYRLGECLDDGYRSKPMKDALDLINRLKGERDCYRNELKYANIEKEALNKLCGEYKAEIEKKDTEIDILIRKKEALRDEISELTAEVERLQKLQKPTKTSGFIIQNGKVVFYSNMLNGYRHEYKDLDEVVKELNL